MDPECTDISERVLKLLGAPWINELLLLTYLLGRGGEPYHVRCKGGGGGGAGNELSSQQTVQSLDSAELEDRVFLVNSAISKRFVFCFAV